MDLARRSVEVILAGQSPSGAYVACPTFANYGFSWLRDGCFIGLQLGAQLADPIGDPLFHRGAALVGRGRNPFDELRNQRAPAVEIGPQLVAFARSHRVEVDQRLLDGRPRLRDDGGLRRLVISRLPIPYGDRLRQAK